MYQIVSDHRYRYTSTKIQQVRFRDEMKFPYFAFIFIKMGTVEDLIRKYNARILEMNETCVVLEKSGHYDETQALFRELSETIGVLQFIRSGRVAIKKAVSSV